ncbi:MAG: hypothetical protein BWY40_00507 [bacterium ADurb.Bin270]|nr:hypothetical protein [Myxococcales bacterium]OQA61671.1 MAG: hypothetical protein BWY40_00507 [bacterium ADurb.Bin270]
MQGQRVGLEISIFSIALPVMEASFPSGCDCIDAREVGAILFSGGFLYVLDRVLARDRFSRNQIGREPL